MDRTLQTGKNYLATVLVMRTKIITLILVLCLINLPGFSQNLSVTFTGTGASTEIDSIEATNLATNQSITLPGNETLELGNGSGIPSDIDLTDNNSVFPNPFIGLATFSTYIEQAQTVYLKVQNLPGQVVAEYSGFVDQGKQQFSIQLKTAGIYSITLLTDQGAASQKMMCTNTGNRTNSIRYDGTKADYSFDGNNSSKTILKRAQSSYFLGFTAGDVMRYKCSSGEYATIKIDSPSASVDYQIEFFECADDDGKNYPVVAIGDQDWMAANLAYLPKVDPSSDGSDSSPYLYVYGYQGSDVSLALEHDNFKMYGVLYNWPAAQIACPEGWHLPTDLEWAWLKEFSNASWLSGFDAMPGGIRQNDGTFGSVGKSAGFWTSTDTDPASAIARNLNFENNLESQEIELKNTGFSVRCVKNQDPSITLPIVNTYPVVGITSCSAEGRGNLISNHALSATVWGICWSTTQNPTLLDHNAGLSEGLGEYTVTLSGLTAGTTYYYRAFATNAAGTGYGAELSFTTLEGGTFTDSRDTRTYHYVKIGGQFWMAENLAYLPVVSQPASMSATDPHYYVYGYDGTDENTAKATANYSTYGVLYNWAASLAACPAGWHLPNKAEFTTLIDHMGGDAIAGYKMKSMHGWNDNAGKNGNGDNSYGFTALPGGDLEGTGVFLNLKDYGSFWTSGADGDANGLMWLLDNFNVGAFLHSYPKSIGVSVRCIKN